MKKVEITLYAYEELSKEAKERAFGKWREEQYDPLMQSHMINLLGEVLDERGIKYGYPLIDLDVRYSLSHCQGDGFMFEGDLTWKGKRVNVKHDGNAHYYHEYTASFDFNEEDAWTEAEENAFEADYRSICKVMERKGYDHIDYTTSEEYFMGECEANEYTFEENGAMRNV